MLIVAVVAVKIGMGGYLRCWLDQLITVLRGTMRILQRNYIYNRLRIVG